METYKNIDNYCPYIDVCYFKKMVLKDAYNKFCEEGFTACARFKRGCLRGINEVPNEMKPIDYNDI